MDLTLRWRLERESKHAAVLAVAVVVVFLRESTRTWLVFIEGAAAGLRSSRP